MDTQKPWLNSHSWEKIKNLNEFLCKQQSIIYQCNASYEAARQLWEKSCSESMSLQQVLDICRRCYELAPFTFNNGNTFATIGKNLVDEWVKTLPAVEGQIIRNTIGHYIAGMVSKKELVKVLAYFETSWKTYTAARQNLTPISMLLTAAPTSARPLWENARRAGDGGSHV